MWGTEGNGPGEFGVNSPTGIAFDSSGNIFVVDQGNARVQKFTPTGAFLLMKNIGTASSLWDIALDSSTMYMFQITKQIIRFSSTAPDLNSFIRAIGSTGTADGQFASNQSPLGIAINPATDYLYVCKL